MEDNNKDNDNVNAGGEANPGTENQGGDAPRSPIGTSQAPDAPKEDKKAKKTVEVDAEVLEKLVTGYEKMSEKIKDLEGAADVGRLDRIQAARNKGKLVKKARLSVYANKVVLGWVKVKDDVYFDEQGRFTEDQQVKLYLDAGVGKVPTETEPMSYRSFSRLTSKIEGEVVKESKDSDGQMFFTVQLEDGRKYELSIVYLN